jgi:hypothetical protein
MANIVFNIAKGRVVEYYNRVEASDPANSALVIVPILTAGLESDAVLKDKDDLAAVLSGATDEATGNGWERKVLTDADLVALPAPDDTGDTYSVALPTQTWTSVTSGTVSKLLVGYDPDTTGGTDSAIIPLTLFDFAITPDGSDVQMTAGNFFTAS